MAINEWLLIVAGATATALAASLFSVNPESVMPVAYESRPIGAPCLPVEMLELRPNRPVLFCSREPAGLRLGTASPGIFYILGLGDERSTRVVSIAEMLDLGIQVKAAHQYYIGTLPYAAWTELPDLIVTVVPE